MSTTAASRALSALSRRVCDTLCISVTSRSAFASSTATPTSFFSITSLSSSSSPTAAQRRQRRHRLFSTSSPSPSSSSSESTVISETSSSSSKRHDIPEGVALLTVDRPSQLNALSSRVMRDLTSAALAADADPRVRAIVVTGSGEKAFAAGADVKELAGITHEEAKKSRLLAHWDRLSHVRVPLIAAVRGLALGGGFELALMCDLVVAGADARFGLPEVRALGVTPGMGATQRLPRALGKYRAMEMVLLGEQIGAQEARDAGLVSRVVSPPERTLREALELAAEIASLPPMAVAAAKRAVSRSLENGTLASGLEEEHSEFWGCFGSPEQKEGMAAFLEKRKPKWPTIP